MCRYTPDCCSVFYPIWCIVYGACVLIGGLATVISLSVSDNDFTYTYTHSYDDTFVSFNVMTDGDGGYVLTYGIIVIVAGAFCVAAGICMLLGIERNNKALFGVGKALSYVLPIVLVFTVFPIVIHFIAIIHLVEYQKKRWGE
ncbi:uncharacterized protein LOC122614144 [Drosophila teissieri]|uniref:uncharacterized protein LOC122614144 n=1 Tax=Drosophila teissieri TaxID=7243 RepID=UPI001CBA4BE1|nr:uncharacterized protein LOC122614144 [Drosophila teissieri]